MTCFISAKSPTDLNHIPHYVWDSEESSIGIASVWFQNWTDYQRLHISSVTDSFDFEPHPYAVTTFKKSIGTPSHIRALTTLYLLETLNGKIVKIGKKVM